MIFSSMRISVKTTLLIVTGITVIVFGTGYYLSSEWTKIDNRSVYQFKGDLLAKQLEQQPGNVQLELQLAMAQYLEGKSDQALRTYRKVLKNDPINITALLYSGLINNDLKNYDEAALLLQKVVLIKPSFQARLLYVNLGTAYFNSGRYSKAISNLKKACVIDPGSATANYYLGLACERTGRYQDAKVALEKAIQIGGATEDAKKALDSVNQSINAAELIH